MKHSSQHQSAAAPTGSRSSRQAGIPSWSPCQGGRGGRDMWKHTDPAYSYRMGPWGSICSAITSALPSTLWSQSLPFFPPCWAGGSQSSWGPGRATFPAAHGIGTLLHPLLSGSACAALNHMLILSSVSACYCNEKSFGLC